MYFVLHSLFSKSQKYNNNIHDFASCNGISLFLLASHFHRFFWPILSALWIVECSKFISCSHATSTTKIGIRATFLYNLYKTAAVVPPALRWMCVYCVCVLDFFFLRVKCSNRATTRWSTIFSLFRVAVYFIVSIVMATEPFRKWFRLWAASSISIKMLNLVSTKTELIRYPFGIS